MPRILIMLASVLGLTAVAMGAFAAHGLQASLSPKGLEVMKTAAQYQMLHALAILAVAILAQHTPHKFLHIAGGLWVFGVICFSGSLYLLTLTSSKGLGVITPIGGILLMSGWLVLGLWAVRGLRK